MALIERAQLGGTCLNRGCIPTKALAHTADIVEMSGRAAEFGLVMERAVVDFREESCPGRTGWWRGFGAG